MRQELQFRLWGLTELKLLKRAAPWLGLAVLLYAVFGFFVVPWIIRREIQSLAQSQLHREARIGKIGFNPFTLVTTIEQFDLLDRDGASLYSIDHFMADFQLSGLFRRAARFREIRIEHPLWSARILANGHPTIEDLIDSDSNAKKSAAPFQLPRLIIDRLIVDSGVVKFSDASRQPVYVSRFEPFNLDVRNLVTIPEETGQHTISIGVEDGAVIRWTGRQTIEPLRLEGQLEITNLNLRRLGEYFAQGQPLQVQDGYLDLILPYEVSRSSDDNLQVKLTRASAVLRSLGIRARDENTDWLAVPELRVEDVQGAWPAASLEVGGVRVRGLHVLTRVGEDGSLNWSKALQPTASAKPASSTPWTFHIGSVAVDGGSLLFEDKSVKPTANVELGDLSASARDISSNSAVPTPIALKARVAEKGSIEISGSVSRAPMTADLKFEGSGLELKPLQAYFENAIGLPLRSGRVSMRGQVSLSDDGRAVKLSSAGALDNVGLDDPQGNRLMSWERMAIEGLTFEMPQGRARIRKITVNRPDATIHIDAGGHLNLSELKSNPKPSATVPSGSSPPVPLKVEITALEFSDGTAEFQDQSLLLPFRAQIHSAAGSLKDLSSFAAAPASLALEGRVDDTGYVKAGGTLRVADPLAASEIGVEFRSIEMSGLTPYFAQFAGYAVKRGVLDLDIRYVVKDRRLIGNHTLNARDLVLGERVKDSKAPSLAVRLAVALLKDKDGRIKMNVPVEGTVDSPEFNYRKVFWTALQTILGNAAKAPFRAIGRLFGKDEDDLELVDFDLGRSDLLPAEADKLARLAEQIGPKHEIVLSVEGRYDPVADQKALKQIRLDKLIDARRDSAAAATAATGGSTLETILESLFTEQFSADGLAAERQRYTTAAAASAGTFDAAAFYEGLRAKLFDAQSVSNADLAALANERAATIVAALTKSGAVEAGRVSLAQPAEAKRKKAGSGGTASEITMSAEGDSAGSNLRMRQ